MSLLLRFPCVPASSPVSLKEVRRSGFVRVIVIPLPITVAGFLFLASSLLEWLAPVPTVQFELLQVGIFLLPLSVVLEDEKWRWRAWLGYASLSGGTAIAFASPPLFLASAVVALYAASHVSYVIGSLVNAVLRLFVVLPPGRWAALRSMFSEAYISNALALTSVAVLSSYAFSPHPLVPILALCLFVLSFYFGLKDETARSLEGELPFLLMLASFFSDAGHRGLEAAIESLATPCDEVFKALGRERLRFLHERLFYSQDPSKGMYSYSRRQKNGLMAQVIDGFSTVASVGGDVHSYLIGQTERSLSSFERSWVEKVRATRGVAEVLLIALALAPSVVLMVSMVGLNSQEVLYSLAVGLPVAALVSLVALDGFLPPIRDRLSIRWGLPLGLLFSSASLYLAEGRFSAPFAFVLATSLALSPISMQYLMGYIRARRDEKGTLKMLVALVESLRVGKGVHEALASIDPISVGHSFHKHISRFNLMVQLGLPPPEAGARVSSDSWITKASFVAVGYAMLLGGGLEVMDRFKGFLSRYIDSWAAVRREAMWVTALSASLPFVTLGGVSVIEMLRGSFGPAEEAPFMAISLQLVPMDVTLLAFVEVSLLAALVSNKLAGLTIKATPVSLVVTLATLTSLLLYGLV